MELNRDYTKLLIWQKGHSIVKAIYKKSAGFPKEEVYGITSQLRRAAVSICANIVEGYGRTSLKEKKRFMDISNGSLEETHYLMFLSSDLGYAEFENEMDELRQLARMMQAYKNKLG